MFCQKCGAQVPDGFGFCSECGSRVEAAQPQPMPQYPPQIQPQPQYPYPPQPQYPYPPQPQPQPQYQQPSQPQRQAVTPDKKGVWLRKKAPAKSKRNAVITTVICILGVLLMAAAVFYAVTVPFFQIPTIAMVVELAEEDPNELMEELEEGLEDTRISYEMEKHTYSSSEKDAAEKILDAMEKTVDCMSVVNMLHFVDVMLEEAQSMPGFTKSDLNDMETIREALVIVIVLCAVVLALPMLFLLLGGLKKSTAMTIVGIVLMILPQLCLGGVLLTLLSLILGILQAVMCGKVNRAYDCYRNECLSGR